jgi:hypothetical protein
MRLWIVMSVGLQLALACTFDATGIDTTIAVGPSPSSVGSDGTTFVSGTGAATQADSSGVTVSDGDSGGMSDSLTGSGPTSPSETTEPSNCGNGVLDDGEDCDGADLGGATCQTLGHTEGTLTCTALCHHDEKDCSSPSCGDGVLDPGEACDCGGAECTAPQLNNTSCTSLPAPQGGNFNGGALACVDPGPCTFDTAGCTYCGDGAKNGPEVCDGADLGGQSCMSNGFFGGAMACSKECMPDTAACNNCGNGVADANEACDGTDLKGKTCKAIDDGKYNGGTPGCRSDCGDFTTDKCTAGNCCQVSAMGGTCSLGLLKTCVCVIKGVCCSTAWDQSCVDIAKNVCGADC